MISCLLSLRRMSHTYRLDGGDTHSNGLLKERTNRCIVAESGEVDNRGSVLG